METVLALDPGIARTGYAVLYKNSDDIKPLKYGCILTQSRTATQIRLQTIYKELIKIIKKYKPEIMVLEQVFFNTNQKTAITVGQAQGIMLFAAAVYKLNVAFVTPLQIKQTLTGYGAADKTQVQKMVATLLNLSKIPKPDDTADAIACGLTYLYQNKMLK